MGTTFEADQLAAIAETAHTIVGLPSDEPEFEFTFDETWETIDDDLDTGERPEAKQALWEEANKPLLEDLIDAAANRPSDSGPTVLYQLPIRGKLQGWPVSGLSDIVVLQPNEQENEVRSLLLEVKA